ncbi:MAG: alpha/beta hydrolase family protein [Chloroflexota bacterium]
MTRNTLALVLCLTLLLAGCGNSPDVTTAPPTNSPPPLDAAPATATQAPPTPTEIPPTTPPEPSLPPLAPDPQRIEFQAEDGAVLVGYYYPAAVNPAPLVVLMHWAGGDQTDWVYVGLAAWLQNRGAQVPAPPESKFFDTPYPFPSLPAEHSYAVFTFDFRGYGESSGSGDQAKHILDARAAYAVAAGLEGVDPARIVGIGASIGADAVADACADNCIAALSLGPGNYLDMAYANAVSAMEGQSKPAWCVATEENEIDLVTCNSASGNHYTRQIYPAGGHAMRLFRAEIGLDPPIETVILDFLDQAFGS